MLDPKLHRTRNIGRDWKRRVQGGDGTYKSRCTACLGSLWPGEAVVVIHKHSMHRQCIKEWLEAGYLEIPATPDEIERTAVGSVELIDPDRLQREFDEYREELLQRLGVGA